MFRDPILVPDPPPLGPRLQVVPEEDERQPRAMRWDPRNRLAIVTELGYDLVVGEPEMKVVGAGMKNLEVAVEFETGELGV